MTDKEIADLPYRPCVGVVLANRAGQVFVGQRTDKSVAAWQMPQGGIDGEEEPRVAALRELREETGVPQALVRVEAETPDWLTYDLPPELIGKAWKGRYRGQKQLWFLVRFLGTDDDIDITADHQEFSAWRWMAPQEVVANIIPFKRDVYAQVMTAFERVL